jgi:hypothetical protein
MSTKLLKYLSDKIQEEIKVLEHDMSLGSAKDFGSYQYACGIVRGLRIANNLFIETSERMENDDD